MEASVVKVQVYASYASDSTHRKSVTGITSQMAGGTILLKTRFQDVVALSSTEAKFIADSDADKTAYTLDSS